MKPNIIFADDNSKKEHADLELSMLYYTSALVYECGNLSVSPLPESYLFVRFEKNLVNVPSDIQTFLHTFASVKPGFEL